MKSNVPSSPYNNVYMEDRLSYRILHAKLGQIKTWMYPSDDLLYVAECDGRLTLLTRSFRAEMASDATKLILCSIPAFLIYGNPNS